MQIHKHPFVRGFLFCTGFLVWALSIFFMAVIALSMYQYALAPAENKLVGVVWFLVGPSIPAALLIGALLLYLGSEVFRAVAPELTRVGWSTLGFLLLGFAVGFFIPGNLASVGAMATSLVAHVAVLLILIGSALYNGYIPWESDLEATAGPSRPRTGRTEDPD